MRARGPRRARAAIPVLLSAVVAASLSCQGDCPPAVRPTPPPPAPVLRARYVLATVNGQPLPFVLAQGAATRVRLIADTLRLDLGASSGGAQPTSGTYTETLVLGTLQPDGSEAFARTVSAPRPWTRPADGPLTLTDFAGGAAAATVTASVFEATGQAGSLPQLVVATVGRTYTFEAR